VLATVNKKDSTALSVESGVFSKEDKPLLKGMSAPGLTADTTVDGKVMFADLKKVVEPTPKPLSESRGLVTAAYQDQLEKDWIKELRAKYPVTVDKDVLYSIK
jgi:peptidyl-prolyl cis-trans isomerase SurA